MDRLGVGDMVPPVVYGCAVGSMFWLAQRYIASMKRLRQRMAIVGSETPLAVVSRACRFTLENAWFIAGVAVYYDSSKCLKWKDNASPLIHLLGGSVVMARLVWLRYHHLKNRKAALKIPDEFAGDPIFNQFTCVILKTPTLNPVRDNLSTSTLYDQAALAETLKRKAASPMTRQPMHKILALFNKARAVESVIRYRLAQLQSPPKTVNTTREKQQWMVDSAKELDQQICALFTAKLDEIRVIPQFLCSAPGMHCCPITGKVIRFPVKPHFREEVTDRNAHRICYEEEALKTFFRESPKAVPPKWPIAYLPLPLCYDHDVIVDHSRLSDIAVSLGKAVEELRQIYEPLPKESDAKTTAAA